MSKFIYDITTDDYLKKMVKNEVNIDYRSKFYVDDFGEFGSKDWLNKLEINNLVSIIEGKISKVYMTGHGNNFPEFEIVVNTGEVRRFERKGDQNSYVVGKVAKLHLINSDIIFTEKIGNDFLLKVEIE